jgi:hypothetical protein
MSTKIGLRVVVPMQALAILLDAVATTLLALGRGALATGMVALGASVLLQLLLVFLGTGVRSRQ